MIPLFCGNISRQAPTFGSPGRPHCKVFSMNNTITRDIMVNMNGSNKMERQYYNSKKGKYQ